MAGKRPLIGCPDWVTSLHAGCNGRMHMDLEGFHNVNENMLKLMLVPYHIGTTVLVTLLLPVSKSRYWYLLSFDSSTGTSTTTRYTRTGNAGVISVPLVLSRDINTGKYTVTIYI